MIALILTATVLSGANTPAQPQDGDLIVPVIRNSKDVLALDLSRGLWSTLFSHTAATPNERLCCVRMARDNTSVIVGTGPIVGWQPPASLLSVDVHLRAATTLLTMRNSAIFGFELDADGWIVGGYAQGAGNYVWFLDDITSPGSFVLTTLAAFPQSGGNGLLTDLTIARGQPLSSKGPYVLSMQNTQLNAFVPRLLRATRTGVITTIIATSVSTLFSPLNALNAVEVDPVSGDFLTCDFGGHVCRVKADGSSVTTLYSVPPMPMKFDDARFTQDGLVWVALSAAPPRLFKMDMTGAVITMHVVPTQSSALEYVKGIEIYGSRKITCAQRSTNVSVRLKSQRTGDANRPYFLACSFNRRPPAPCKCLRFPGGDYLFLDYNDPLFWTSFLGLAPHVFQNFQGTTDAFGAATATINVRPQIPAWNITIFVAGVILNPGGPTVTNTHWFAL